MGPQEFDHEGQEDGSEEEKKDGSRRAASSVGHGKKSLWAEGCEGPRRVGRPQAPRAAKKRNVRAK